MSYILNKNYEEKWGPKKPLFEFFIIGFLILIIAIVTYIVAGEDASEWVLIGGLPVQILRFGYVVYKKSQIGKQ